MKLHANAALSAKQREEVRRLHTHQGVSVRKLAHRFAVNPTTIQRWVGRPSPLDLSTAPLHPRTSVTPRYRRAVLEYRSRNPHHGPVRIAVELRGAFPQANRGTVLRILQGEGLTRPKPPAARHAQPIPVGFHRIQMDVQQLPAVQGGKGFAYKVSAIHLRTRLKYSEIHPRATSRVVAGVLKRALDRLPPFSSPGPTTP